MAEPIDHQIVLGLAALLRDIRVSNGYRTDAGEYVLEEESRGDVPEDATTISVLDDDEEAAYQSRLRRSAELRVVIAIGFPNQTAVDAAVRKKVRYLFADIRQALSKVDPLNWISGPTGRVSGLEIGGRAMFIREAGSSIYRPELRVRVTFNETHRSLP